MAAPSVQDVIKTLGQISAAYDAYFDKHKRSDIKAAHFADCVREFKEILEQQKERYEELGMEFEVSTSILLTLKECRAILKKYKDITSPNGKRWSFKSVVQLGQFPFDQHQMDIVQQRIAWATTRLMMKNQHLEMKNAHSVPAHNYLPALAAVKEYSTNTSAPFETDAAVGEDSLLHPPQNKNFDQSLVGEYLVARDDENRTELILPTSEPIHPKRQHEHSTSQSPRSMPARPERLTDSLDTLPVGSLPGLPPPALEFHVAHIEHEGRGFVIQDKPIARTLETKMGRGREVLVLNESGTRLLQHKMTVVERELGRDIYPYTWHPFVKNRELEVTFKGPILHQIVPSPHLLQSTFNLTDATKPKVPRYVFFNIKDFEEFQSQVRGKDMVAAVPFIEIRSSYPKTSVLGEASEQNIKFWRESISGVEVYSISFYRNGPVKHEDIEFPLSLLKRDINSARDGKFVTVEFDFGPPAPKRKWSFSPSLIPRKMSTSPDIRPISNMSVSPEFSSLPEPYFIVTDSPMAENPCSTTSIQADVNRLQSRGSAIELRAREMKQLKIEFADSEDAKKFCKLYQTIWQAQALSDSSSRLSLTGSGTTSPMFTSPTFSSPMFTSPAKSGRSEYGASNDATSVFTRLPDSVTSDDEPVYQLESKICNT